MLSTSPTMTSIDQKIARSTGGLPPFLQRKIKFVEALSEDTVGKSQISYNQSTKRASSSSPDDNKNRSCLFDKGLVEVSMNWPNVFHIGPGLSNLGNTCFLNSVLQCLMYSAPFTNILLKRLHGKQCRVEGFCLICEMEKQAHITFTSQQKRRHLSPNGVVANIKLIGKQFRLGRQEDAHEFLRYFIEAMQKVCLNGLDPKLENRIKETTMVHAVFGGYLQSKITCHTCKHESNVYEPLLDLSLEVKSATSVHNALRQFTAAEILSKENRYRCDSCKKLTDASKRFQVHEAPNVLTIHLKRFQMFPSGFVKIHREIEFTPELDLSPFLTSSNGRTIYDLYAVLVHDGQSCNSGHYHCFVKNSNGVWYSMNDESVHQVSLATVLKQKAYILFYQKRMNVKQEKENVQPPLPTKKQKIDQTSLDSSVPKQASPTKQSSAKKTKTDQEVSVEEEVEVEDLSLDKVISKSMWHLKRFISSSSAAASRVFPRWKVTDLTPRKK